MILYMGTADKFYQETTNSGQRRAMVHGAKLATIDASTDELPVGTWVSDLVVSTSFSFIDWYPEAVMSLLTMNPATLVTDFSLFSSPVSAACANKLVFNSTTVFVDGYTYVSSWRTSPASGTENMPLTYIFADSSGSCPITNCGIMTNSQDLATYPLFNRRANYDTAGSVSGMAASTTNLIITQSAVGISSQFVI